MSRWHNSTPEERIFNWRTLRNELDGLSVEAQSQKVVQYFADCPVGKSHINCYDLQSWPTPWEILSQKIYCVNSISILMFDTLKIINNNTSRVTLCLVQDESGSFLVPVVDNNCVLNYESGAVSTWPNQQIALIQQHTCDQRQYR